MTAQLVTTAVVSGLSFWSADYKAWIQSHPALVWISVSKPHVYMRAGCIAGHLVLDYAIPSSFPTLNRTTNPRSLRQQLFGSIAFLVLTYWKRLSYPTNLLFLSGFTLLEAYTISVIVSFYQTKIVLNAVILTGGIFVFLTLFACQTKYDFTSWMPYLFGALWGLLLFGFIAAFLPYSSTGELIYGGLAALVFSGYILVATQLVLRKQHVEEEIAAAISLYLDIINLFLAILRILNSQSNN